MKKVKLLLTMAVIVFATMICCSMSAFALTDGDWEFQLLDNEVKITGYIGEGGDVVIPETLYGAPVTKVDIKAHSSNNFSKATSLVFPSTVKDITGEWYFGDWGGNVLEKVVFPEGVETIDEYSFNGCKITSLVFPSTLKRIGRNAFSGCELLTSVQFPEKMEKIGSWCFSECGLTEVTLPVVEICGEWIFAQNPNLKKALIADKNTIVPECIFYECTGLEEVLIPFTVQRIEQSAFSGCTSLKQVILPTDLKFIGQTAFYHCDSLKEVVIPYGVEELGSTIFAKCDNLKSLYVPDTVAKIDMGGSGLIYGSDNCIVYCTDNSVAADYCKKKEVSYLTDNSVNSGIHVLYNGTRISFHSYGQNPELLESRTLVPLRSIFEAMGAEVEWDGATSTAIAKRDGIEIKIQIGANEMYKDGKAIPVDVPAQLLNDRTMVPVRVIAEAFGADVDWNGNGRTVLITE
ncbi:MAG: leucine-rich repeat protein [Clostridia bacterium]|nr:leucine-rich repeat protein [Clostridia bacterium]